jgi:predicted nucleic acid-binding protein
LKGVKVLDSSALLAYFEDEAGSVEVTKMLQEAAEKEKNLLISVVNWGEVLYIIEMRYGSEKRGAVEHLMNQMHLEVVDADKELTRAAAHLKAAEKLPYGDAFAAALALNRKAELVTSDKDFKSVDGKIQIRWI